MAHTKDDKILEEALEAFEAAEQKEHHNRVSAREDLVFGRLGEQWHATDIESRTNEHRPILTVNRLPAFIRQIVNDARLNKPSIKVHPVDDDSDPLTAEVINGIIRNIEVQSKADLAYDTAIDSAVSCGFGYLRVDVDYARDDTFDQDITINRIANPFTVYGDPLSDAADSSDWNRAFVTDLLTEDEFDKAYPGEEHSNWEAAEGQTENLWGDEDGIRVAEYWRRSEVMRKLLKFSDGTVLTEEAYLENEGQLKAMFDSAGLSVTAERDIPGYEVEQYLMTGAAILSRVEWAGKYIPIIPCYGDEVNVEGKRYFNSLIKFAKDPQRMVNYWRTTATELVALAPKAPWVGAKGSFDTDPNWGSANTKSHPYLEYDVVQGGTPPQRQPFAGVPAGALNEAMMASDDMKATLGMFDASLGARSNETSGVAIKARDRQSDISNFHFIDNMTRCIRQAGIVVLDLIPSVYNEARVMRIMGEDMTTPDTVQVNQQIPHPEGGQDEEGNPRTHVYDLTTGKYDVTVKAGPSFTTRREEAADQMMNLLQAFPSAAPYVGDILAESLDWPRSDDIAKRLKMLLPEHLRDDDEEGNPEAEALQAKLQEGIKMFQQLQGEHSMALEALEQQKQAHALDKSFEDRKLSLEETKIRQGDKKLDLDRYNAETNRIDKQAEAAKDLQTARNEGWAMQLDILNAQAADPKPNSGLFNGD
jgi:hypothetical protein